MTKSIKRTTEPNPTSGSASAKLRRAVNQLENVQVLLRSMPKYVFKKRRKVIDQLLLELDQITETTRVELAKDD